jgi:rhodanese-related sulfurtransferase
VEDARAGAQEEGEVTELPFQRERPDSTVATPLSLRELAAYALLDARSPSEFAEDHLPGAINVPVLDDDERALVGTIYKQRSAFDAKRAGAPIVSRNIARHIETLFAQMPRTWKPLVYCWRGGGRSGSLAHVLRQVGWDACASRAATRRSATGGGRSRGASQPRALRVVCGATGSGKKPALEALASAGRRCWTSSHGRAPRLAAGRAARCAAAFAEILRDGDLDSTSGFDPARRLRRVRRAGRSATCACPKR